MSSWKQNLTGLRWTGKKLLLAAMLAATAAVWAQGIGSISGRAVDSSAAAVPSANVTVRNTETGETRTTITDESGFYRVLSLPVGKYEVRVENKGFMAQVRSGINLSVGQEAVVNVTLEVGTLSQEVTVTGEAPMVNTTTAETSGLVGERAVKDLPLNGRSFDNLVSLNAGTVDFSSVHTTTSQYSGGLGKLFSISGRRPDANLFLLNGVQYAGNGRQADSPGSVSGQLLGIDAVREFNVLPENYSAEYGKKFGGQISIVTMSGTNQLHGSAFEFLRNSALDARNFFDYGSATGGRRLPAFERNNFGGSLGAPIHKDKSFIFGNYEGFRQRLGLSNVAVVPNLDARRGLVPSGTNGPLTDVGVAPGVAPYIALYPVPNGQDVGGGAAEYFNSPQQTVREDFGTARFDQIFSTKDSLNSVYTIDDGIALTPQVSNTFTTNLNYRAQVASLTEVHVFSPGLLNTFTAGFSRATFLSQDSPLIPVPAGLNFIQGEQIGQISIGAAGGNSGGALTQIGAINPAGSSRNLFTETDNVQLTKGRHLLSFGVWFHNVQDNANQGSNIGKATFSTLTTLLRGQMQTFQAAPFSSPLGFRTFEGAWYISDTIKVRPNLTVNAGLRHEFTNGWNEQHGRLARYPVGPDGVIATQPIVGPHGFAENKAKFLLGPRLGIAWDVFGNGKTAVHTGFGLYYNLLDALSFGGGANNPPFSSTIIISNSTFPFPQITPANVTTLPGVQPSPGSWAADQKTPEVVAYNFKIEQGLGSNLVLSMGYVGNHTYHLQMQEDLNPVAPVFCGSAPGDCPAGLVKGTVYYPVGGKRKNPVFSIAKCFCTYAVSSYNGLVVELTQRAKYGLTFKSNFTWAKTLDDSSATGTYTNHSSIVLNPFNFRQDWGPASFDTRKRFSFSGSDELPIGSGKQLWSGAKGLAVKI